MFDCLLWKRTYVRTKLYYELVTVRYVKRREDEMKKLITDAPVQTTAELVAIVLMVAVLFIR